MKQKKRTKKDDSQIGESEALLQSVVANSFLEWIRPADVQKLSSAIRDYAKAVPDRTISVRWGNGTTFEEGCLVAAIAYTTEDGFVLRFTVKGTSKLCSEG